MLQAFRYVHQLLLFGYAPLTEELDISDDGDDKLQVSMGPSVARFF